MRKVYNLLRKLIPTNKALMRTDYYNQDNYVKITLKKLKLMIKNKPSKYSNPHKNPEKHHKLSP